MQKNIPPQDFDHATWPCGAMDNAYDHVSEDSRFESWQGRDIFLLSNSTHHHHLSQMSPTELLTNTYVYFL